MLVRPASREGHRKIAHRLKRDRPADRAITSIVCTEVKRARVVAGVEDRKRKFSTSDALTVLQQAVKAWQAGDRQLGTERLREFCIEHAGVLQEGHAECSVLLIQIATLSTNSLLTQTCIRSVCCIMQSAPDINELWTAVRPLLRSYDPTWVQRWGLEASLLGLFENALDRELLDASQLITAREMASRSLHSDDYQRRIAALNLYIALAVKGTDNAEWLFFQKALCTLSDDRDARVRFAAVRGLAKLAQSLSFHMYAVAKQLASNTDKSVRIESLRILKNFADRLPEREVRGVNDAKLRLVDDAFSVVCHAINDLQLEVRAEAARLLGTFEQVSDCFLDQTLDKKLLNAMRMSKFQSASRRPGEWNRFKQRSTTSKEWSTGKKLGEDVPVERIEDERSSIIPAGACGAFITALEDEFMAVRQAAVYSLGQLAAHRPFLADAAIDNLSDMFNDEIEEVRLDAIYALTPLVVHGVLHKEQLDTMLTVLDDASPDSREALRMLLTKATLDSPECVRHSVNALLNCLQRFPIDESSIFQCLCDLGRRHGSFVQPLIANLLKLNAVFEIVECELDDSFYVAKLMLVLNAASVDDTLCSLLPPFVIRHYRYLRSSMSDLIPFIKRLSSGEMALAKDEKRVLKRNEVKRETIHSLECLLDKLCQACLMQSYHQRSVIMTRLLSDIAGMCGADANVTATARFLASMGKLLYQYDMITHRLSSFADINSVIALVEQGLDMTDHLENEYRSVDVSLLGMMAEYRFRLILLRVITRIDCEHLSSTDAHRLLEQQMQAFHVRIAELVVPPSSHIVSVIEGIEDQLSMCTAKKPIAGRSLMRLFHSDHLIPPLKPRSFSVMSLKWAEIIEPNEPFKEPIRFKAGFPMGVRFNIVLHNLDSADMDKFRLKIGYSAVRSVLYRPRKTDVKVVSSQAHRFLGQVLVESNAWSNPGQVRVSCVLLVPSGKAIPLLQSPSSNKLAYKDIPIYPVTKCSF